jgi:hypothetical protein
MRMGIKRYAQLRGSAVVLILASLGMVGWQSVERNTEVDPGSSEVISPEGLPESFTPQVPISDVADDQHVLFVGMHVDKVYELSLQSRTFSADGYIWVEWSGATQQFLEIEELQPTELVRLVNQIESWDSTFEPEGTEPVMLSAGRRYQRFRFSSRFYDDEINFERDPFDVLILPIVVEVGPDAMSDKYEQALLYPHHEQNGFLGLSGTLSGYRLEGASLEPLLHTYPSRFGSWYQPTKSLVRLEIHYRSDYWSAFVRWVLPLLVIMSVVIMTPTVAGSLADIRLAVPTTALLTLVFIHQAYRDDLPSLPYLTLLDNLFTWSYLICVGLFALFAWGTNVYARAPADQKAETAIRIDKVDLIFQCSALALLLVGTAIVWLRTGL